MKKIAFIFMLMCFSMSAFAVYGTHHVRAYTKSDGTYVRGHEAGNPGSGVHCHGEYD